jgi:hypothetical protein
LDVEALARATDGATGAEIRWLFQQVKMATTSLGEAVSTAISTARGPNGSSRDCDGLEDAADTGADAALADALADAVAAIQRRVAGRIARASATDEEAAAAASR